MPYKDPEKQKAYDREWYARNREARNLARKKRLAERASKGVCYYCGGFIQEESYKMCNTCRYIRSLRLKKYKESLPPERMFEYKTSNLKRITKYNKELREFVLNKYGGKCVCCGEANLRFLTIDHTGNNGNAHRKSDPKAKAIYTWLKVNNYPEGFQVMCYNCNCGRYHNGGICPHKTALDLEE